ncbi:MAG: hypothetical protein Q9216_002936 [Gyalolechia sp. 2 TL-2023]
MANYIPHADLDPYATYHQQPNYPSYPHPVNFAQPHPLPEVQAQRYHHAPQQYYQAPGHGPPGSMPPPSTIPDSSFHRQHYPHPSAPRTPDRWPLGVTDDQRQLQEQYQQQCTHLIKATVLLPCQAHQLISVPIFPAQTPQIHPNYHHSSPFSSAPPAGPVSTFPAPSQHRTSPQIQPPPQSPRVSQAPSSASQKPQQSMTVTTAKPVPPSNLALPNPPTDPAKSAPVSTAQPTLEAQRVTALLELNCILLEEVVKDQAAQKAIQSQQKLQQTSSPSNTDDASKSNSDSKPDSAAPNKQDPDSTAADDSKDINTTNKSTQPQSQPQNAPGQKTPNTKEYIEYMRRLQANLAYLASVADRSHKPGSVVHQYPAIMEAPNLPSPPPSAKEKKESAEKDGRESIKESYAKLRELWPEYKGKGAATAQGAAVGITTSQAPATTSAP